MSHVLTYELIDDPHREHEVEIHGAFPFILARAHLDTIGREHIQWVSLTNDKGQEVADSWDLL